MQLRESSAIILQVSNLQERDRIVSFLTPDYGLKRGVANGARTKFSRFQGVLHSLAEVTMSWAEKQGRDLVRISDATLIRGTANQSLPLEQLLVGEYFAESIEKFTVENDSAALEYRLLSACVGALRSGTPVDPLMRYFELWLLQLTGIFSLEGLCPMCGNSLSGGSVLPDDADALICRSCSQDGMIGGRTYDHKVMEFARACVGTKPGNLTGGDRGELRRVEDLAREIRQRFLGAPLRSYTVMKRTLSEVG